MFTNLNQPEPRGKERPFFQAKNVPSHHIPPSYTEIFYIPKETEQAKKSKKEKELYTIVFGVLWVISCSALKLLGNHRYD